MNFKINLILTILTLLSGSLNAAIIPLDAEYSVPVNAAEDLKINTFKLNNYEVETFENGSAIMRFEVPSTMTGISKQNFELKLVGKTSETTKILSGPAAKAVCTGPWINMDCSITFLKLKVDKDNLKNELLNNFNESEASSRFHMLLRFSNDPIGTAKVKAAQ